MDVLSILGFILLGSGGFVFLMAMGFDEPDISLAAIPLFVMGAIFFIGSVFVQVDYDNGKQYVTSRAATPSDAFKAYNACITNPADQHIKDALEWRKGCVDGAKERGLVFKLGEDGKDVVTAG